MMSGVRKRSKRSSSHNIPARHAESELGAGFRHRKEKNVQLHDEADLVNFRADNIRRFAQNQELLQNVVSNLVHTSRIKPPRVFPEPSEQHASKSDPELEKLVQDANASELLVFSDIRLMQAKSRLLGAEISQQAGVKAGEGVFSAESAFQKGACETLAQLQSEHRFGGSDSDVLERMEEALTQIQKQCAEKYKTRLRASHVRYTKTSIGATALDPHAVVSRAPSGYSARESSGDFSAPVDEGAGHMNSRVNQDEQMFCENTGSRFGGSSEPVGATGGSSQGLGPESQESDAAGQKVRHATQAISQNQPMGHQPMDRQPMDHQPMDHQPMDHQPMGHQPMSPNQPMGQQSLDHQPISPTHPMSPNQPMGHQPMSPNHPMSPHQALSPKQNYNEFDEMIKPPEKRGSREDELSNLGVNMDDLDRFLADPSHGNSEMDEMDALMNFDQEMDGDQGLHNADSMDDSFGVDFLSQMD